MYAVWDLHTTVGRYPLRMRVTSSHKQKSCILCGLRVHVCWRETDCGLQQRRASFHYRSEKPVTAARIKYLQATDRRVTQDYKTSPPANSLKANEKKLNS